MDSLESSNQKKNDQKNIQSLTLTHKHVTRNVDYLLSQISQIVNQTDHRNRHIKQYSKKCLQIKQLKEQIQYLQQRNKLLEQKLGEDKISLVKQNQRLSQQNEKLKLKIRQQRSEGSENKSNDMDVQQNSSSSSHNIQKKLNKQGNTIQRQIYDQNQQMIKIARLQNQMETQNLEDLSTFIMKLVDSLMIRFQYYAPSYQNNTNAIFAGSQITGDKIVVSRQKFKHLLNFYSQSVIQKYLQNINNQSFKNDPNSIKQFQNIKIQNISGNILDIKKILPSEQSTEDLQSLFEVLAKRAGLQSQWILFLNKNKQQAIRFKSQLQLIANGGKGLVQKQQRNKDLQLNISLIQKYQKNLQNTYFSQREQNQSFSQDNSSIDPSFSNLAPNSITQKQKIIMNAAKQQIEDSVFQKIQQIIKKLSFRSKQIQIYEEWNKKRKMQKMYGHSNQLAFNVQEIFKTQFQSKSKSKNQKERKSQVGQQLSLVSELSKQFSLWLIKSINMTFTKLMKHILSSEQNPEVINGQNSSIRKQIIKSSESIISNLHKIIELKNTKYIEELINKDGSSKRISSRYDNNSEIQKIIQLLISRHIETFKNHFLVYNKPITIEIV